MDTRAASAESAKAFARHLGETNGGTLSVARAMEAACRLWALCDEPNRGKAYVYAGLWMRKGAEIEMERARDRGE